MNKKVTKSHYIFDKELPTDWVKKYSKSKNGIYFFNRKTGKSQWLTPSFPSSSSTSPSTPNGNAKKNGNIAKKVETSNDMEKKSPIMCSIRSPHKNQHSGKHSVAIKHSTNSKTEQKAQSRLTALRNQLELAKQIRNEKIKKTVGSQTTSPGTKIRPTQNESKKETTTSSSSSSPSIDNNEHSTGKRKIYDAGSLHIIKDTSINKIKKLKTNIEKQEQLDKPPDKNKLKKSSIVTPPTHMKAEKKLPVTPSSRAQQTSSLSDNNSTLSIPKINYELISFNNNKQHNRSSTITTTPRNLRLNSFQIPKISAQKRLQNLRESLSLEQKEPQQQQQKQQSSIITNASDASEVSTKINRPLTFIQPTTIVTTEHNANYDNDDVVMEEDFSLDPPIFNHDEDDESMDWEDIPEEIVIQEVHKFRSHNSDNFQIQKATEQSFDNNQWKLNNNNNNTNDQNPFNNNNDKFFIVIDTNILLKTNGKYKQLETMMENILKVSSNALIIIPFMVLNELDKLKNDRSISKLARLAVRFLNGQFQNDQNRIRGQSAIDHNKKFIDITNADDNILNCCIQLKCNNRNVILLSNDINLRNKSLASSIKSYSYEDFSVIKRINLEKC